jgi:AcrR family transcriptional regulator
LAQFNTNRVAEVAGVSIGSLYQYFPSKDALIAKLILAEQERLAVAVEGCISLSGATDLPQALRRLVRVALAHPWGNPVFSSALDHEEERLPIREELQAFQFRIVSAVAALLGKHCAAHAPAARLQVAKDCVVICKALVDAEGEKRPGKAFEARLVATLHAVVQRKLPAKP